MRQLSAQCLLDHQVDQLAGYADGLDDRLALEPLGDGFLSGSLHLLVGGVAGDVDAAADLAEHLYNDLHRVLDGLGQVELGPGGGVGIALAAERLMPQLVGPERADGGKDAHDILSHAVAHRLVTGSALINFSIISGLFLFFLLCIGQFPGIVLLGTIPLLAILILFAASLGIFLGTVNVFFRDVGQGYGILCQFWFWFTPLVYPASIVPERFQNLLELNPMVQIMGGFHTIFLEHQWPDYVSLLPITLLILVLAIVALLFFRCHSCEIVDEL